VTVHDRKVTVRRHASDRTWLLEEVGRKAGVPVVVAEPAGEVTSIELINVPLDEAVRRIASGNDAFFYYAAEGSGPPVLKAVWLYPKGRARKLEPGPPEAWVSAKELAVRLSDPDPDTRSRAYEAALDRRTGAADLVNRLLREEKDPDVRTRVLSVVLARDSRLPADLRMWLASSDPSEQVRMLSLESLAGDPGLRRAAETALTDLSQEVRLRAKEILQDLDGAPADVRAP
jgi:hypothetical protein